MISVTRRPMTEREREWAGVIVTAWRDPGVGVRIGCGAATVVAASLPVLLAGALGGFFGSTGFWSLLVGVCVLTAAAMVWLDRISDTVTPSAAALAADEVEVTRYAATRVVAVAADPARGKDFVHPVTLDGVMDYYYDLGDGQLMCRQGTDTQATPNSDFERLRTPNGMIWFAEALHGHKLTPIETYAREDAQRFWPLRPPDFEVFPGTLETLFEDLQAYARRRAS
jgi:hypothetical protein